MDNIIFETTFNKIQLIKDRTVQKTSFILFILLLYSCSPSSKITIFEQRQLINDEFISLDLVFNSKDTLLKYSCNIVPYNIEIPDNKGNVVRYVLWTPPYNFDKSKLAVMVPGINLKNQLLYPIAFELIKTGLSVCFINLRESENSLNSKLMRDTINHEINDLIKFIDFYKEEYEVDSLKLAFYGISLGAVICLNYINNSNEDIRLLVTEGLPYNLEASKKRMNLKNKSDIESALINFSTDKLKLKNNKSTFVFSIWGKNDPIVPYNEIQAAISKLKAHFLSFNFKIIDTQLHTFRTAINENMYFEINKEIIQHILSKM